MTARIKITPSAAKPPFEASMNIFRTSNQLPATANAGLAAQSFKGLAPMEMGSVRG
jgi:hypothetical protein